MRQACLDVGAYEEGNHHLGAVGLEVRSDLSHEPEVSSFRCDVGVLYAGRRKVCGIEVAVAVSDHLNNVTSLAEELRKADQLPFRPAETEGRYDTGDRQAPKLS